MRVFRGFWVSFIYLGVLVFVFIGSEFVLEAVEALSSLEDFLFVVFGLGVWGSYLYVGVYIGARWFRASSV